MYFHEGGIFDEGCFIIVSCLLESCTAQMVVFFSVDNSLEITEKRRRLNTIEFFFSFIKDFAAGLSHGRMFSQPFPKVEMFTVNSFFLNKSMDRTSLMLE